MSLYCIRDTAKEFHVSERHVRRMIAEGRWPFFRVGRGAIRLDVEEIKKLGRLAAEGTREVGRDG